MDLSGGEKRGILGLGFEQLAGWIAIPFLRWGDIQLNNIQGTGESEIYFGHVNFEMSSSYLDLYVGILRKESRNTY